MKEKQANFEFSFIALFNFYLIFAKAVKLQEERTSKHRVAQIQARKSRQERPIRLVGVRTLATTSSYKI